MNDRIILPRSAITSDLWRDEAYGRVLWYLISEADDTGTATFRPCDLEIRFDLSRQRLRTILDRIVKNCIATKEQPTSNQRATKLVFDIQQDTPSLQPKSNQAPTNEQPTTNQLPTNKQPTKRTKKAAKFTPPTDADVITYVAEKGYHFNPESFVPHYQSKGWKVGDQPMKDWRAACRTWETRWKEKHGEKFYYEIQPLAGRGSLARQADRYSDLERAAETVLRNAPYGYPAQND